jgi:hypothetical protein
MDLSSDNVKTEQLGSLGLVASEERQDIYGPCRSCNR